MVTRPVLIIGPLSDVVVEKLTGDYPHKFAKCEPEPMTCNQETLEKGIMSNILVDFRKRGNKFECYTVSAIKEICDRVRTLYFEYSHGSFSRVFLLCQIWIGNYYVKNPVKNENWCF